MDESLLRDAFWSAGDTNTIYIDNLNGEEDEEIETPSPHPQDDLSYDVDQQGSFRGPDVVSHQSTSSEGQRFEFLGWSFPFPKRVVTPDHNDSERFWDYMRYGEALDRLNKSRAPNTPCTGCISRLDIVFGMVPKPVTETSDGVGQHETITESLLMEELPTPTCSTALSMACECFSTDE